MMNNEKQKSSKPFCSLAYLAKSTIAINGNNGIRIVNGNTNNNSNNNNNNNNYVTSNKNNHSDSGNANNAHQTLPNVAETARLKACASPELPTGAATTTATAAKTTNVCNNNNNSSRYRTTKTATTTAAATIKQDYFGDINEEQPPDPLEKQKQQQRTQQQQQQQQQQQKEQRIINNSIRPWELRIGNCMHTDAIFSTDLNDDEFENVRCARTMQTNAANVVVVDNNNTHHNNNNNTYNYVNYAEHNDHDHDDNDNDVANAYANDEDVIDYDLLDSNLINSQQRIPVSLMSNAHASATQLQQQNAGNTLHSCLTSLQSRLNSLDCWDYTIELECLKGPQDLQLAAELGKTLLERNKELEILLKEHKTNNEEQEREILHLRKQINAMSEVNDSRLKVYESLEVGIQELERTNHRLNVEKTRDKKQLKTLTHNIENLETRCEELTKQLEESRQTLLAERRKNERLLQDRSNARQNADELNNGMRLRHTGDLKENANGNEHESGYNANTTAPENCSFIFEQRHKANSTGLSDSLNHERSSELSGGSVGGVAGVVVDDNEELVKLVNDLESTKRAFVTEQQRCSELEEQLVAIIQENQTLQSRIAQTSANEEMMSMQDEFSILDEVRQGQMCSRCLRAVEDRATNNDEQSSVAPTEDADEEDERSLLGLDVNGRDNDNASETGSQLVYHRAASAAAMSSTGGVSIKINPRAPDSLDLNAPASPNPYRDLVEKYEALLEVQRSSIARKTGASGNGNGNGNDLGLSLADEFQSSIDFNQTQKLMFQAAAAVVNDSVACCNASNDSAILDTSITVAGSKDISANSVAGVDGASSCNDSISNEIASSVAGSKQGKNVVRGGRTPTEFSEAETSSSGFSDETSNKCTQTEERPGYFLCSIGDGEDCKFSIYDDVSPIDSRFRNRPEYRELFKEIFAVLKKAAENKEEGDKLPLLDDEDAVNAAAAAAAGANVVKVPPVTPANEELPVDFADDTQSIISSAVSEQSFAMSECITKLERKTAKKHIIEKNQENKPPSMLAASTSIAQLSTPGGAVVGSGVAGAIVGGGKQIIENGRVLTPFKREPLEYLSIGVGIKKKGRRKNRTHNSGERVESPLALPTPPRFYMASPSGKRGRKDLVQISEMTPTSTPERVARRNAAAAAAAATNSKYEWNGSPMVIYNRNLSAGARASRVHEFAVNGVEYRLNTVSQEFHKLKKLDLSYAEVLRRADACEHHHQQQQRIQRQLQQQQRRRASGNNVNNSHHHHH